MDYPNQMTPRTHKEPEQMTPTRPTREDNPLGTTIIKIQTSVRPLFHKVLDDNKTWTQPLELYMTHVKINSAKVIMATKVDTERR